LLQRCLKVLNDLLSNDVGIREVVGGFEGFVVEPEGVDAGFIIITAS
jgi:hypothetical protein